MITLTGTKRKYVLIGVIGITFIVGLILIYVQYNTLGELREEVQEEEIAVESAQAQVNQLMTHRDRAEEYRNRLDFAKSKIPNQPREEEVLRYLQQLVNQHDLKAVEISFAERVEEEGYISMPLSMTIEGSYSGIRQLLYHLRGGDRAVRVDDLSLSRAGDDGSDLQISISANTFYRP